MIAHTIYLKWYVKYQNVNNTQYVTQINIKFNAKLKLIKNDLILN